MLDFFTVSHKTDGKTVCKITVEPNKREASIIVTVDRIIVRQGDENDIFTKSFAYSEWYDIPMWERKAAEIAKTFSPFWRGESAT